MDVYLVRHAYPEIESKIYFLKAIGSEILNVDLTPMTFVK